MKNDERLIFAIFNNHPDAAPDTMITNRQGGYVAYFTNEDSEQLIFTYDRQFNAGLLYHSDNDWEPSTINDGIPDIILTGLEFSWVLLCWKAASGNDPGLEKINAYLKAIGEA